MDNLYNQIKDFGKVRTDEPFAKHNKIGLGGNVNYFAFVDNIEELVELLKFLDAGGHEHFVYGIGDNILVGSQGFRGIAIKLEANNKKVQGNKVVCEAGADIEKVSQFSMQNNLSGFEWGVGGFGSIAGAVYNQEMIDNHSLEDIIESIKIYNNQEVFDLATVNFDELEQILHEDNAVILELTLRLEKDDISVDKNLEYVRYKNENFPNMKPYLGPLFKNITLEEIEDSSIENSQFDLDPKGRVEPKKIIQYDLIDKTSQGPLEIFKDNNNFIIRDQKGGSPEDALALIENIEQSVYDNFKLELKRRVGLVGEFNNY